MPPDSAFTYGLINKHREVQRRFRKNSFDLPEAPDFHRRSGCANAPRLCALFICFGTRLRFFLSSLISSSVKCLMPMKSFPRLTCINQFVEFSLNRGAITVL